MRPETLADTGFLLAMLDRDDRWHAACVRAFDECRLPLATSAAVLTELFHLVGDSRREVAVAWTLVQSGALSVLPIADGDLLALAQLMERFADRPMDFADATLVHLAGRERISRVATVDHDDFETYRIGPRGKFTLVPGRLPRHR